jgi:hypothetical protein
MFGLRLSARIQMGTISFHFDLSLSRRVQTIRLSSLFLTDTNFMFRIVDFNVIFIMGVKKKGEKKILQGTMNTLISSIKSDIKPLVNFIFYFTWDDMTCLHENKKSRRRRHYYYLRNLHRNLFWDLLWILLVFLIKK